MSGSTQGETTNPQEIVDVTEPLLSPAPPHPSPTVSVAQKVAYGTLWSAASRGMATFAAMVSTPFATRMLGAEGYGIWALANSIIAYLCFTEMGSGTASTKFAAESHSRKDELAEVAVIWTSLLITLFPAGAGILFVVVAANYLVGDVFAVPENLRADAAMVVRLTALGFGARLIVGVLNTPQLVRLRIDLYEGLNIGFTVMQHSLIVAVLLLGWGLSGVVGVATGCVLFMALSQGVASCSLLPSLLRPRIDVQLIRPLLFFARGIILSLILGYVLTNAERLFLARLGSVKELAYYSIATGLSALLLVIPNSLQQPLLPTLSALHSMNDKLSLERLFWQGMRTSVLWGLPTGFLLFTLGEPFLRIWAGSEFAARSSVPLYILIPGSICYTMAYIPHCLLTALGKTGIIARCHLIQIVPFLMLAACLTYMFGAAGAALATSLRMLIEAILLFTAARKALGFSFHVPIEEWRNYAVSLAILVVLALACCLLGTNLYARLLIAVSGCALFGGVAWLKILSSNERQALLRLIPLRL